MLVSSGKSTYRYVGELDCDWSRFCELSSLAEAAQSDDERFGLLTSALKLVRGKPFEGVPVALPVGFRRAPCRLRDVRRDRNGGLNGLGATMLRGGRTKRQQRLYDEAEACAQPYSRLLWTVSHVVGPGPGRLNRFTGKTTTALGDDTELADLVSELAGAER